MDLNSFHRTTLLTPEVLESTRKVVNSLRDHGCRVIAAAAFPAVGESIGVQCAVNLIYAMPLEAYATVPLSVNAAHSREGREIRAGDTAINCRSITEAITAEGLHEMMCNPLAEHIVRHPGLEQAVTAAAAAGGRMEQERRSLALLYMERQWRWRSNFIRFGGDPVYAGQPLTKPSQRRWSAGAAELQLMLELLLRGGSRQDQVREAARATRTVTLPEQGKPLQKAAGERDTYRQAEKTFGPAVFDSNRTKKERDLHEQYQRDIALYVMREVVPRVQAPQILDDAVFQHGEKPAPRQPSLRSQALDAIARMEAVPAQGRVVRAQTPDFRL